jgi:hypothetical protein
VSISLKFKPVRCYNILGVGSNKCCEGVISVDSNSYANWNGIGTIELWLVLEEDPKDRKGYKIVFDETKRQFGLAMTQRNGPDFLLGFYGTFMDTLESM